MFNTIKLLLNLLNSRYLFSVQEFQIIEQYSTIGLTHIFNADSKKETLLERKIF